MPRRWFLAIRLALAVLEVTVALIAAAVVAALVIIDAWVLALLLVGVMGWLVFPHLALEYLVIPRGAYRLAAALGRRGPYADGARTGWFAAARALARAGAPADGAAWLLAQLPERVDAAVIAVHGVLAAGRDDRAEARRLLASIADTVDPCPSARALAGTWLALDAAERGAWDELTGEARWPATPLTFLLEAVAARATGAKAPSAVNLWLRWAIAPHRRATLPLVRAATRPAPPAPPAPAPVAGPAVDDARAAAVVALRQAQADRRPADVATAVTAWAAIVDEPAWLPTQQARGEALGLAPDQAALAATAMVEALTAQLAELVVAAHAPLPAPGPGLAGAVTARARARILDGVELELGLLHRRIAADQALPPIDEWREFLAVRQRYHDTVLAGGAELAQVAFPRANSALGDWAVWMWNQRRQHVVSHAITSWLYLQAQAVGDAAAVEHHGANRALRVPTT
ncbi:MAG: hypothetical protein R3B06_19675 [Kofleriaceae bacterium]